MQKSVQPFILHQPQNTASLSPVVFDSPHSGRDLPFHFKFSCEQDKLADFGDLHVDKLLADIPARGIVMLESLIHRACVDLNRHRFELDPMDLRDGWDEPHTLSHYTKSGLGVIPRRLGRPHDNPLTLIFNEASRPDAQEVRYRFNKYHRPYYEALNGVLNAARNEHGFFVHVNMHSFFRRAEECTDDIIIGDLSGSACNSDITDFVADHFRDNGFTVDFNGMFQGGALVQHTSDPHQGAHAVQIEVARDLYLDDEMRNYDDEKAAKLQNTLTALATALDVFTRDPAQAAHLKAGSLKTARQLSRNNVSIGPKPPA